MRYNDFYKAVKESLKKFSNGCGTFKGKEKYPHILRIQQGEKKEDVIRNYNLLECCKPLCFLLKGKCHQYAHHLNSSQLMCYNFFRPLIDEKGYASEKLISILKAMGINIDSSNNSQCVFEYEQNSGGWEQEGRRKTNFDFYVKSGETEVFFEIKYTEQGFGKAKKDKAHKDKYDKFYKAKISECPAIADAINKYDNYFINNYQIIRNVIRVTNENKYVVFVYDENNKIVRSQLKKFVKDNIVQYKDNIIGVSWQYIVNKLEPKHQKQFRKKYLSYSCTK